MDILEQVLCCKRIWKVPWWPWRRRQEGGSLPSRHLLSRPKVLHRQELSGQISSATLPGQFKQKSQGMCQPQPGAQSIAGAEGQQRDKGVPRLWPGPQGCILSDLARLAESTEQPGEEGAECKEKPSAALPLPSQLIRGTTGARRPGQAADGRTARVTIAGTSPAWKGPVG